MTDDDICGLLYSGDKIVKYCNVDDKNKIIKEYEYNAERKDKECKKVI